MGYRSDVKFICRVTTSEFSLRAYIAGKLLTGELDKEVCDDVIEIIDINGEDYTEEILYFKELDYVKWYESYKDVSQLMSIVHELTGVAESDDHLSFIDTAFIRTGEDVDDIEEIYGGQDPYEMLRAEVITTCEYDFYNGY